ncbi:hypothetical protein PsYK624_082330 [Phanerochaete sordida]|uniref:Protein kinase domain-containing protein n=1 Tax=Phanerochaete sordida TaxID=48140 RepID=A0A9P3LEB6_9APHY|nr:hypothetical protein PsYK624_082330 [Phanerochaete sordida]
MSSHPVIAPMPPGEFMDRFMNIAELGAAPPADFSSVITGRTVKDMCQVFIRAVEKFNVCPGMRLFLTKTKKQRTVPKPQDRSTPSVERAASIKTCNDSLRGGDELCPPLGARKQPRHRRGIKKRRDLSEYHSFATCRLGIEAHHIAEADPFEDPPEWMLREPTPEADIVSDASSSRKTPDPQASNGPATPLLASPTDSTPRNPSPTMSELLARSSSSPDGSASPAGTPATPTRDRSGEPQEPQDCSPTSSTPPYESFDNRSETGTASRDALISHATAQFAHQHRVFFFQLIIAHRWARFIRWDRRGAVVTQRFDYVSNPGTLGDFLWRFSHMSDEEQGWDPTVSLASKKEATLFQKAVNSFIRSPGSHDSAAVRRLPHAERTLDDTGTYPVWKIRVDNAETGESTDLLVNRPFAGHHSLTGRATRAYIALDLRHNRLLFLKDCWRDTSTESRPEFQTYQELSKHDIEHVPVALYGGDVRTDAGQLQETSTQLIAVSQEPWRITVMSDTHALVHHRVVQHIFYPLECVRGERELVQVIYDVLCAIEQAHRRAGILHRDISLRNVMMTSEGRGILNDWDFSGQKERLGTGVGTWAFMSVGLLTNPEKLQDVEDDLEAVFWVLLYSTLKHFAPPCPDFPLSVFSTETFDLKGRTIGGYDKRAAIRRKSHKKVEFSCPQLRDLIHDMGDSWAKYHSSLRGFGAATPEISHELRRMHELAPTPPFWLEMVSSALNRFPETKTYVIAERQSVPVDPAAPSDESRKRKAEDLAENGHTHPGPRRSKRLRLKTCK